jgi:hypothetical protein
VISVQIGNARQLLGSILLSKILLMAVTGMTGKLERPESWNDRKARRTGKPELSEKLERPDISLCQCIGGRTVHFLKRQRGPNY